MLDSVHQAVHSPAFLNPTPDPVVSPEVAFYQQYLGQGTTPQEAQQFIQGMERWMNAVFSSYANGEKRANENLKKSEQI